jgi:hypothetical protein
VCILGSTGSIGTQALDLVRRNPDRLWVVGLTAGERNREPFEAQITTISEHPGSGVASTDHHGAAPATPPATAVARTSHAEGVGTQTLRWKAIDGRQTPFAMNADGSRSVQVRIESAAVTLDRMAWWVAGAIALGSFGLVSGVLVRLIWRPHGP